MRSFVRCSKYFPAPEYNPLAVALCQLHEGHDGACGPYSADSEALRLTVELQSVRAALAASRAEVERLTGEAAAMRERLLDLAHFFRGWYQGDYAQALDAKVNCEKIDAALALDAGKGWVSPDEHAKVVAEAAAMRDALDAKAIVTFAHVYGAGWRCRVCEVTANEKYNLVHADDCPFALASSAGSALLAEVRALREVEKTAFSVATTFGCESTDPGEVDLRRQALQAALAAVWKSRTA